MRGRFVSVALLAVVLLLAFRGLADEGVPLAEAVKVEPGKCIEGSLLVSRIEMWLKRTTIDRRLRVEVKASKTANDIHFTIFRDEKVVGEKSMRAEMSCAEFQSAVALAIASALDAIILEVEREVAAQGMLDAKAPEPIPDAGVEIFAPLASIPDAARIAPPPPKPETTRLLVGLESGLDATHLPTATMLIKPTIDVRLVRWLDARAAFGFTPEISSTLVSLGITSRVVTQLVMGEAHGCYVWRGLPVLPRGCLGIAAGAIRAHGAEVARSESNTAWWSALSVRIDARWPVDGLLAVLLAFTVDSVFAPPSLTIGNKPEIAELKVPPVGISLLGGMQLRVF